MFLKMTLLKSSKEKVIYVNTDYLVSFHGFGKGSSIAVKGSDAHHIRIVKESPDEICALLAEAQGAGK
jgi:hypothetical protein